jgi:hypothetical protein
MHARPTRQGVRDCSWMEFNFSSGGRISEGIASHGMSVQLCLPFGQISSLWIIEKELHGSNKVALRSATGKYLGFVGRTEDVKDGAAVVLGPERMVWEMKEVGTHDGAQVFKYATSMSARLRPVLIFS